MDTDLELLTEEERRMLTQRSSTAAEVWWAKHLAAERQKCQQDEAQVQWYKANCVAYLTGRTLDDGTAEVRDIQHELNVALQRAQIATTLKEAIGKLEEELASECRKRQEAEAALQEARKDCGRLLFHCAGNDSSITIEMIRQDIDAAMKEKP